MSTLTIPRSDLALYASLNDDVKKEVREWQQCMAALTDARRIGVGRRPQYKRDSDGKKDSVKERDARFLVASI